MPVLLAAFNAQLAPDDVITLDTAIASKQTSLYHLLDVAGWNEQLAQRP
jgi:hypothetical protein